MSMLNSIRTAEANAESKRSTASEQVTLLLEQAKIKAETQAKLMRETADAIEISRKETNLSEVAAKQTEIDLTFAKRDETTAKAAKKRIDQAVEFILGKVIKS